MVLGLFSYGLDLLDRMSSFVVVVEKRLSPPRVVRVTHMVLYGAVDYVRWSRVARQTSGVEYACICSFSMTASIHPGILLLSGVR